MNSNFENYVTYFYKCSTITNICFRKLLFLSKYVIIKVYGKTAIGSSPIVETSIHIERRTIMKKNAVAIMLVVVLVAVLNGCAGLRGTVNELRGDITGNTYKIDTFDNFGNRTMTTHGQKINVTPNVVEEQSYSSDGGWISTKTLSAVITINVDGHQVISSGDTMIFYEDGLEPIVDFTLEEINSYSEGKLEENTIISGIVNRYRNWFGKSEIIIIKSQMGTPIYAFEGNEVYWNVPDNLPKFTKLTVDGKQLYIHRANFQIVDKALIGE